MSDLFAHHAPPPVELDAAERLNWLRLIRSDTIGPTAFYRLLERFGSASKVMERLPDLFRRGGRDTLPNICTVEAAQREYEALRAYGAQLICAADPLYPLPLSALPDAPPVLIVKGRAELLNRQNIGIVGSRNASLNGRAFARTLAADLGRAGQTIVSGLARGIDTAAHEGSLATGTIAVVAGGVDIVYPEENQKLYEQICDSGLVVAESPFAQKPFAQSFPRRNRIISGLSAGIVVVEANLKSGSLITARLAAEQGRDVFAVPGFPSDPRAQGPNKLIRDGATLVQSAEDILHSLQTFRPSIPRSFQDSAAIANDFIHEYEEDDSVIRNAAQELLSRLSKAPVQTDTLLRDCNLSPAAGQRALLELELAGTIRRSAGGMISLAV